MAADWITGGILLPAVFRKSPKSSNGVLKSRAGWKGLCRKTMTLLYVLIAARLDLLLSVDYVRDAVCNLALGNRESMMSTLQENIEAVIRQEDETSSEGIEAKLLDLQKELLKLANSKKDYNSVADEIDRLRELKQNALVESAEREGLKQRIREMREFLEQQSTEVTEYDELLVRRLIEKVTVYDERFEVEFKSGAEIEIIRFRS